MNTPLPWQTAKTILAVRLDTIGDVLMTTPALRALKEGSPDRRLTLLTSPPGAVVAPLVPEIDDVIVYEAPWMKAAPPRARSHADHALVQRLRGRFDAAVIFTVYSQNPLPAAFLCYLAEVPRRLAHCHENPYQLLTDWVPDPEPATQVRHEVRRHLDLVATVGAVTCDERLSLRAPADDFLQAQAVLADLGVELTRPWVLIHPGATAASRRYPPASFAAAARTLAVEDGLPVLFSGSAGEQDLVTEIQAAMDVPSHSLAGRLTLGELAAMIALSPVLISNNSGPVHIAAAVGTPVVDLYALTNPQHTPWQVPHRLLYHDVPCKFCYRSVCPLGHHDCLRRVPALTVVQATRELLAGRPSPQPVEEVVR